MKRSLSIQGMRRLGAFSDDLRGVDLTEPVSGCKNPLRLRGRGRRRPRRQRVQISRCGGCRPRGGDGRRRSRQFGFDEAINLPIAGLTSALCKNGEQCQKRFTPFFELSLTGPLWENVLMDNSHKKIALPRFRTSESLSPSELTSS